MIVNWREGDFHFPFDHNMVAYPKELTIKEGDYYQKKYIAPNQLKRLRYKCH